MSNKKLIRSRIQLKQNSYKLQMTIFNIVLSHQLFPFLSDGHLRTLYLLYLLFAIE